MHVSCYEACIGCTSWLKCCDHDVFGNCVKCPGWKPCCWHGKNPICKAKNHACRIMKQVAAENLQTIAVSTLLSSSNPRLRKRWRVYISPIMHCGPKWMSLNGCLLKDRRKAGGRFVYPAKISH